MKILEVNSEWRLLVDNNGNYIPERYIKKDGGEIIGGNETKAFEGWKRQDSYFPNEIQAISWIAKKANHEGGSEHVLESLQDIASRIKAMMAELNA